MTICRIFPPKFENGMSNLFTSKGTHALCAQMRAMRVYTNLVAHSIDDS
jgi:hypothetical protein